MRPGSTAIPVSSASSTPETPQVCLAIELSVCEMKQLLEFCQRVCAHLTFIIKLWLSHVIGQVQSRQCIEEVIRFAKEEHLFLLADEVIHLNSDIFHLQFPLS